MWRVPEKIVWLPFIYVFCLWKSKVLPSAMVVRVYIFNSITVIVVQLPARLPPLMVTSPPGVPPSFPWRNFFWRQKRGEAAFKLVRVAADGVAGVAVVGALAVEAEVAGRRDEEGLQQVALRQRIQIA